MLTSSIVGIMKPFLLLAFLLLLDSALAYLGGRRQQIIVQPPSGSIDFNSTQIGEDITFQEWILDSVTSSLETGAILFRIFVVSLRLPVNGSECPLDKRFVIGDADETLGASSVAYCGQLDNFEVAVYAKRVRLRLQCPPTSSDEEIIINFQFATMNPDASVNSLRRSGRQTCQSSKTDQRLWACRPVFYAGGICETQCISSAQICNKNLDCPNGEDESEATCQNNRTKSAISMLQQWDSIPSPTDFPSTQIPFKLSPASNSRVPLDSLTAPAVKLLCNFDEFQCRSVDGTRGCISSAWVCDDKYDCALGEDESPWLCQSTNGLPIAQVEVGCPSSTFSCPADAKCIEARFVCDGRQDCFNSVDESPTACEWQKNYSSVYSPMNETNQTATKFIEWGLQSRICPPTNLFYCAARGVCLNISSLCDGNIDCPDGSDETTRTCLLRERYNKLNSVPTPVKTGCQAGDAPPPWIARVSSGSCFLCFGVTIEGRKNNWWVLIPSACGKYLPISSLEVYTGNSTNKYA